MRKRGYKTELDLTNEQVTACLKHAGCARKAYNWGLARKQEARVKGEPMPDARALHRELNALKASEFPYMYECSKCAPQEALIDLEWDSMSGAARLSTKPEMPDVACWWFPGGSHLPKRVQVVAGGIPI